jgi:hypothetical protein
MTNIIGSFRNFVNAPKNYTCSGLDRSRRLQEVEVFRISRKSAHGGGKVFSPKHHPPLSPQERLLVLVCVRG